MSIALIKNLTLTSEVETSRKDESSSYVEWMKLKNEAKKARMIKEIENEGAHRDELEESKMQQEETKEPYDPFAV